MLPIEAGVDASVGDAKATVDAWVAADVVDDSKQTLTDASESGCPLLDAGALCFESAVAYDASTSADATPSPDSVVIGDFNGDGKADLVTANYNSSDLSLFWGNGDGTFQAPVSQYLSGAKPAFLTTGDFDGNGLLDIVVANSSTNDVSVLYGRGNGTFSGPLNYHVTTDCCQQAMPVFVVTGDFNGDGKLDIATANWQGTNDVGVLLNWGDGTFDSPVSYGYLQQSAPCSLATADFNGDGKLDLAVANFGANAVRVLAGNGDGTFQTPTVAAAIAFPQSVTSGDFNGDGRADLAFVSGASAAVNVILGNGDGTFRPPTSYATPSAPQQVRTGDFNRDGKLDLVTANENSNDVSILIGNGDGSFQGAASFGVGLVPFSTATGDLNGDCQPDLAVTNFHGNDVSVLLHCP